MQKRIKDETMPTVPLPCRSTVEMERYPFKGYHLKKKPYLREAEFTIVVE